MPNINPTTEDLHKENRALKRKLSLLEANLHRAQLIANAQERVDTILAESLKKELQFFKLVLENTTNILLLFDFDGRFAYASNIFLARAGIANFGFINGRHFADVLRPIVSAECLSNFSKAVNNAVVLKSTVNLEEEMDFNCQGRPRTYSILITPMTGADGQSTGIMALFNDITEINAAMEAAKRASLAKTDFLANMSHEIRTPLNAIIGMSAIARDNGDIAKIHYCLDKINDSSQHLLGIINDILDMSKIEANHFELSFAEFVFEKMLLRVIGVMRFKMEEKSIDFSFSYDDAIPYSIFSDEQRLAQVIMNLLSNAIKFTPQHGQISLRAILEEIRGQEYILRLEVKDSGIGISEEQKPRLFKVFSQADSSISRKYGGTGLGLVICKSIVNMLDGDIWFESSKDAGTTFVFNIKTRACSQNAPLGGGGQDTAGDSTALIADFRGKNVLLADDIPINREIIAALLEDTGMNIVDAENGRDAVEKFMADPTGFDLIFMDVQMPEMDGYEATRRIRRCGLGNFRQIPIVAMTANVFKEDVQRCLAAGMNDHMGKPINLEEVLAKLNHWLNIT